MVYNRDMIIAEHLTNKSPTLFSLQKELDETNKKVSNLNTEFESMQKTMKSAGDQAAAAQASLKAIPKGYNNVIPTSGQSTK